MCAGDFLYLFGTGLMLFRLVFAAYLSQFAPWAMVVEVLAVLAIFFGLWKTR